MTRYSKTSHTNYRLLSCIFIFFLSLTFLLSAYQPVSANNQQTSRQLIQEEMELLRGRTFTVAYNQNHKPFQYTDELGVANGTVVAMLNQLAQEYNFLVDYKEYDSEEAKNGSYDIVIATMANINDLAKNYQGTVAYQDERLMLVFKKELTLQAIRNEAHNIALIQYIVPVHELRQEFPKAMFDFYDSSDKLLEAYDSNIIDAALFSRTLLDASMFGEMAFIREHYNEENNIIASGIEVEQKFYISNDLVRPFLPIFNAMLSDVGYIASLLYDAEPHLEEMPFSAPAYFSVTLIAEIIIIIGVIIIIFISIKLYRSRQKISVRKIDKKTSLLSLDSFVIEVDKKLKKIEPNEYELIGIDIDLFKLIIAYYGNDIAEKLILNMADMLKNFFIREDALITRHSADYFLIFAKTNNDDRKMRKFVEEVLTPSFKETTGQHYEVSFSVGRYVVNNPSIPFSEMITFSELARRQGKNIHTNTFYTFDEVMNKQYHDKLNITYRMTSALEKHEFIIEFQPKIDLKKLKIMGAEALVRWHPENEDKIYPNDFIPVFEKNGFIAKLDVYVFEEVCKFIEENRALCSNIKIAFNLSPVTLAKPEIVDDIIAIAKKHAVDPTKLEVEILESVIDDIPISDLIQRLNAFRQFGFSIALDDFGAGASSLNRFGLLPIDVVKLDKKFIDNIDNERMAFTVKHFINNSRDLKLSIVAEGIETKDQYNWLKDAECDIAQGYLFARPQSKEGFIEVLKADYLYLM